MVRRWLVVGALASFLACGGGGGSAGAPGSGGGAGAAEMGGRGGAAATGGQGGGVGVNEDVGASPDVWSHAKCPPSATPAGGTLTFADGTCAAFTQKAATFYDGAFLVASEEGFRLDVEMLPDHSAAESLVLHRGPGDRPPSTSTCYVWGFKSLCAGVVVSPGNPRHVVLTDVILKSKFDAAPEILVNGALELDDPRQTNTFVPVREACGPATAIGRYGGCTARLLADFTLPAGLTSSKDGSVCAVSLAAGVLSFENGGRSFKASLDGAPEDQLTITLNAQTFYTYRIDAGERFPGSNQLATHLVLQITNDGIDTVMADVRESPSVAFETITCRGTTPEQPWNHPWP